MSDALTIWDCDTCRTYSNLPGLCIECGRALRPHTYVRSDELAALRARIAELEAALVDAVDHEYPSLEYCELIKRARETLKSGSHD